MAHEVGAAAGGGGPVLTASIGGGMLLASHCIVIPAGATEPEPQPEASTERRTTPAILPPGGL